MARELTPDLRKRLGLPRPDETPYRWSFALLLAALAAVPLLLAKMPWVAAGVFVVALGVLPAVRWHERRERLARERVYTDGTEVIARVTAVEPGGDDRRALRPVRIQFLAGERSIETAVHGSPLARRGLQPGDDVVVLFDPVEPQRCLLLDRVARDRKKKNKPSHLRLVAPN